MQYHLQFLILLNSDNTRMPIALKRTQLKYQLTKYYIRAQYFK